MFSQPRYLREQGYDAGPFSSHGGRPHGHQLDILDSRTEQDGCPLAVSWWPESWPESNENKILSLLYSRAMSKKELAAKLGVTADSNSLKRPIKVLAEEKKFIELTLKDKPNSSLQKYRITKVGVEYIQSMKIEA